MKNAQTIEALSLLLTAGTAAGALLGSSFPQHLYLWTGIALAMTCAFLALLLLTRKPLFCLPLLMSIGLLGYLTAALPPSVSGTFPLARRTGEVFRALIDSISFPHGHTGPLLKALLSGDRSGLGKETVAIFRRSGAAHLLALSGLHLGIIYVIFSKVLQIGGNSPASRILRFCLTVPATLFFTLMTGASPSIVRAFLFITLNETVRLTGRRRHPVKIFCAALLIQLTATPGVITSVGFQLSYSAMLGIFLLFPPMQRWFPAGSGWNPVRKIWETAALSIACQATTAPLAWLYFRTFPRYFLLTNLLSIPLTTAVIGLGIACTALTGCGRCPGVLTRLTDGAATLLLRTLEIIASL